MTQDAPVPCMLTRLPLYSAPWHQPYPHFQGDMSPPAKERGARISVSNESNILLDPEVLTEYSTQALVLTVLATLVKYTTDENEMRVLYEYLAEASVVFPRVFPVMWVTVCMKVLCCVFQYTLWGRCLIVLSLHILVLNAPYGLVLVLILQLNFFSHHSVSEHSHPLLDAKITSVLSLCHDRVILSAVQSIIQNMVACEDQGHQQLHQLQSWGFGGLWRFAGPFTKVCKWQKVELHCRWGVE